MSIQRLRPELQRTLAISVALLALLLSAVMIAPKVARLAKTRQLAAACREGVERSQRQIMLEAARLPSHPFAVQAQSKDEQLVFLKELSRIVARSRVRLVSYGQPPRESTTGGESVQDKAVLAPRGTEVSVAGSYSDLVALFNGLASSDRLFTVENLQIRNESYPRLCATFRLVRYVKSERAAKLEGNKGAS